MVILAVLAMALVVIAGCGDDESSSASSEGSTSSSTSSDAGGVAEAKKLVAAAEAPTTEGPDLPPVKIGSSLNGKSIFYISSGLSFPFSQNIVKGVKGAADKLQMTVKVTDTAGDPSKASALIDRAVSEKSSAIVLQGTDPTAVKAAIQGAKSADIPVVAVASLTAGPLPADVASTGISGAVDFDTAAIAKALAAYVVANGGEGTHVGVISSSTFRSAPALVDSFTSEVERLCPDCELKTEDSPLPQWQSGLPSLARTMATTDPEMSYMFPMVDAMIPAVKPSLVAAGMEGKVKLVSQNASLPDMKAIATDGEMEVANVGAPSEWMGWATVDQVGRLLTGTDAVENAGLPLRLFTSANISEVDLSKPEATWYGPFDFESFYTELWGV